MEEQDDTSHQYIGHLLAISQPQGRLAKKCQVYKLE